MKNIDPRGGFIALMSSIIIAVVLMGLVTTLSFSGFLGRFNVLNSEYKERSYAVAEGCANMAIINLGADPGYAGDATTTIGNGTCHIFPVTLTGSQATVAVQGVSKTSYTNLVLNVDTDTLITSNFREVPTLP